MHTDKYIFRTQRKPPGPITPNSMEADKRPELLGVVRVQHGTVLTDSTVVLHLMALGTYLRINKNNQSSIVCS